MNKGARLLQLGVWLKLLRDNAMILYYAWRHPLTPNYLKGILAALVIYLISPIDILPDYLPLLGIADDAGLVTGAALYLTKLLPAPVLEESRRKSEKWGRRMPYILGIIAVAAIGWIVLVIAFFRKVFFE